MFYECFVENGKNIGKSLNYSIYCWRSTHGEKAVQDFFSQKLVNAVNWVILIDRFGFLSIYFKNMSVLVRCWKEELLLFRVLFYFHLACNCLLFGVSTHLADNSFCFLLFLHICTHTQTLPKMLIQKSQFHHKGIWFAALFVHVLLPHCHGTPLPTSILIRI